MSYYSSSNSNYLSNTHLSYNYHAPGSSAPPPQTYRSQLNLRTTTLPHHFHYQPHFYVPPPSFMSHKRERPLTSSTTPTTTTTTTTISSYADDSIPMSIVKTCSRESLNSTKDDSITLPVKRVETPVRSHSVSNLLASSSRKSDYDFEKNASSSSSSSSNATKSAAAPVKDTIVPFKPSDSNDLAATAISNIQLNPTDDLMTQVDYFLNEIDNRMICSGKQIEIEGFDLLSKGGLISRCMYINELLADAKMNETNLDSDPLFTHSGRAILLFTDRKDAEEFANKHSSKFDVSFQNKNTSSSSNNNNNNNNIQRSVSVDKLKSQQQKKNVSFTDNTNLSSSNDEEENGNEKSNGKSILKKSNNTSSSVSSLNTEDPITSRSSLGIKLGRGAHNDSAYSSSSSNDYLRASNPDLSLSNKNKSDNDILITTNSSKKSKLEGYEILTIRAKLKQRVNENRSKQVTLGDIDSIMRNVVNIIQDEFMKRFPSGPAPSVTSTNSTVVKKN